MAHPQEIGVIGAGSARFAMDFVTDMCLTPQLAGSEVKFFDVDNSRLDAITRLARRYAHEMSVDLRFKSSPNIQDAVSDADFVINTALAGGRATMERERDAVEKGAKIYRGIGVNIPFRQLRLIQDIAENTARYGKNAIPLSLRLF